MKRWGFVAAVLAVLGGWCRAPGMGTAWAASPAVLKFAQGWNSMLAAYVKDGVVDYKGWSARSGELDSLLDGLKDVSANDLGTGSAPLAFWIDAYNSRVVREVLHGQSAATSFGRVRLFFFTSFRVAGESWSLDSLEKMIRRQGEPRVHFALNCASRSCPKLRSASYYLSADQLGAVLDERGRMFLQDPSRNRFDVPDRIAYLSEIFKWYGGDFERGGHTLQARLAPYAVPRVGALLRQNALNVQYLSYNWNLNGTR